MGFLTIRSFCSIVWMVVIVSSSNVLALLWNVAKYKHAHHISADEIGPAARAVDGNKNQDWDGFSCMHTALEHNPYWEVDLGAIYVIDHIKIYNRLDCCGHRTRDVIIELSQDGTVYTQVAFHAGQIPDIYTCYPENSNLGRWVRITINATTEMNMCEVEVMSGRKIESALLQNVAKYKHAHHSSTDEIGPAARAVDGNENPDWEGFSCMHTALEPNPYWEVDLGDIYVIDHIKIYNRLDCCADRTRDVLTELSLDGAVYTLFAFHAGQIPNVYTCYPENSNLGRLVRITIKATTKMNMCEVEVMSGLKIGNVLGLFKRFRHIPSVKGTGPVLNMTNENSDIACTNQCSLNVHCAGVNVLTSTNSFGCQLLGSDESVQTNETDVYFWKVLAYA